MKALTETLQEELRNQAESAGEEIKDKIREDTVKRLIHFLKEDKLPTPKSGSQTDQNEPAIYISELQTLTKQTQDKLQDISQLADKTSKASEEEKQAKLELNSYEAENEEAHGPLADKVAKLEKIYTTLVGLELELDEIRKKGNIIAYEKKARVPDNDTLSQERVDKFKVELESRRIPLNDTCKMVQPTQDGIDQLRYRTEATKYSSQ